MVCKVRDTATWKWNIGQTRKRWGESGASRGRKQWEKQPAFNPMRFFGTPFASGQSKRHTQLAGRGVSKISMGWMQALLPPFLIMSYRASEHIRPPSFLTNTFSSVLCNCFGYSPALPPCFVSLLLDCPSQSSFWSSSRPPTRGGRIDCKYEPKMKITPKTLQLHRLYKT